ncbi:MAG: ABC transporter substrate-binding protein [Anaerolineae bacterium]|nr:ABC transporter substrate-binding protein [Anaerolineae bacterium]
MKKLTIFVIVILATMLAPMTALAQEPGSGGPVIEGNFGGSVNFGAMNPLRNNDTATIRITALMFPTVIGVSGITQTYGLVGDEAVYGALTTGYTVSDDGLVYTFTLRDDATWTDGTPITTKDVKFSFDAIASGAIDAPLYGFFNYVADGNPTGVTEIRIIDDYTYEAVFEVAACTALGLGAGFPVVPSHVWNYDGSPDFDFSVLKDHPFDSNPSPAFGPFEFASFNPGEAVAVKATTTWPDGVVIPSGFIYRDVPDQTVLAEQFLAGETNFIDGPPVQRRPDIRAAANVVAVDMPGNSWDYVGLNLADPDNPQPGRDENGNPIDQGHHPIFGDVRVRRALQHAINVEDIVSGAVFGEGSVMASSQIPTSWAKDPNLAPIPYDPDLAAQMLDEAGWPLGPDGVRICQGCLYAEEGAPFEFELITNQGNTRREAIGQIIQDQLYDLGINVDFQAIDWQTLLDQTFGAQTFDAYVIGWRQGFPDDPDQIQLFGSANDDPANQSSNAVSYYNPRFEELSLQASTLPGCDPAERAAIYYEIEKMLQDDQPYLWLFVQNTMYAASTEVAGFSPYPNAPLWNVHTWTIAQ